MVKECMGLLEQKGVQALRMGYLYDGVHKEDLKIPDELDIFVENKYKKYDIPDISVEKLQNIVSINGFAKFYEKEDSDKISMKIALFGLKSFFNHSRKSNLKIESIASNVVFIFATEDIEEGTELVMDYCPEIQD